MLWKPSGWSDGVHLRDDSCGGFCSSSLQRKAAHTGMCFQHAEHLSGMKAELRHGFREEAWKLCSAHRVILCLECVITLEVNQLHLDVHRCTCPRQLQTGSNEQFKFTSLSCKVGKSPFELRAKCAQFSSKVRSRENSGGHIA